MPSASTAASAHCRHCAALARACSASLVRPAASAFSACRSNCSARARELVGAGLSLRIRPARRRGVAHLLLDRPQPALQLGAALAGHLADRVPLVADGAQRGPGGVGIGGVDASRPGPAAPPWRRRSRGTRRRARRSTALRAVKNLSWARLEPLPQRVVDILGRPAGGLPLGQQVAERRTGRAPLGGVGQFLGALTQRLLGLAGADPLAVQLGEMRAAAPVERLAGRRVPLPQRVVGLAVQPGDRAPLVEDLAQPVAGGLPLSGVGRRCPRPRRPAPPCGRSARPGARRAAHVRPAAAESACSAIAASRAANASTSPSTARRRQAFGQVRAAAALILRASPVPDASRRSISATSVCRSSKRRPKCANAASVSPACQEPMTPLAGGGDQPHRAVGVDPAEPVRIAGGRGRDGRRRADRAGGRGAAVRAGGCGLGRGSPPGSLVVISVTSYPPRGVIRAPAARRGAWSLSFRTLFKQVAAPCAHAFAVHFCGSVASRAAGTAGSWLDDDRRSDGQGGHRRAAGPGAAFFIAIGDVIHQRSAHEVTDEPVSHLGLFTRLLRDGQWWLGSLVPPPGSRCRPPRSGSARCCWSRRCWSPRCCSRCRSTPG